MTSFTQDIPRTPAEVHNYIFSNISGKIENIATMHENPCFEIFFPLFNGLADRAKYHSQVCRKNATSKLQSLTQRENEDFKESAEKIENPLNGCASGSIHDLEYFKCIADKADEIAAYFKKIEKMYAEKSRHHVEEMERINEEELLCLEKVTEKSKFETELAYENLQKCSISGKWPSTPSSNDDHYQQDDNGDPFESEDKNKRKESIFGMNIPTAIAVPVGLAITFSAIFMGTIVYKSKKKHGQIMNAETNSEI